jgi:O-antigen/teichoic acid export membrane protein
VQGPLGALPGPAPRARSLRRNAAVSTVTSIVRGLLAFAAALVVTRGLSTAGRGTFSLVTATSTVLLMLSALGIGTAMTRAKATGRTAVDELYRASFVVGAAIGSVASLVFLLTFVLARQSLFSGVTTEEAVLVAVALPPLLILNHWTVVAYLEDRIAEISAALTAGGVLFLLSVGVIGVIGSLTAPIVVLAWVVTSLVPFTLLLRSSRLPKGPRTRKVARELVAYGLRVNVATVALTLAWRADVFLVKGYRGVVELAMYGVAVGLCEVLLQVALSLRIALTPLQGTSSNRASLVDVLSVVTRLTLGSGVVAAVVVALAARPLVVLLYGDRYAAAAGAVRWLIPGIIVLVAQGPLIDFLLTEGQVAGVTAITIAALAVNVGANVTLLPHHTFVVAAVVSTITYATSCGLLLLLFVLTTKTRWRRVLVPTPTDLRMLRRRRRPSSAGL